MAEAGNSRVVDVLTADPVSHEQHEPAQTEGSPMGEKTDASEVPDIVSGKTQVPQTAQVYITFLVISGRRRTMSFEPRTTLGRVKELVWNSWPPGMCQDLYLYQSLLRPVLQSGKTSGRVHLRFSACFISDGCFKTTTPSPVRE
ncbi:hypothetical protein C0991_008868 [Blastosporella zonata]|nr:hypothetical protein C0991_008868 [Blastosporella zonata]